METTMEREYASYVCRVIFQEIVTERRYYRGEHGFGSKVADLSGLKYFS